MFKNAVQNNHLVFQCVLHFLTFFIEIFFSNYTLIRSIRFVRTCCQLQDFSRGILQLWILIARGFSLLRAHDLPELKIRSAKTHDWLLWAASKVIPKANETKNNSKYSHQSVFAVRSINVKKWKNSNCSARSLRQKPYSLWMGKK